MSANKAVYQEAYDRALAGKSRSLFGVLLWAFEDAYSRQSRERGERDGALARAAAGESPATL